MNRPIILTIPGNSKYLCVVRGTLRSFLECHRVTESLAGMLVLCVDEACSNIIKYSYEGNCDEPIELSFQCDDQVFTVEIRDYGKQCDAKRIKPRPLDEVRPGGLGTHFIFKIMDNVNYCTNREKGTLLTMTKRLEGCSQVVNQN